MGFETTLPLTLVLKNDFDLNYFPMGFETYPTIRDSRKRRQIWTISLWDLKHTFSNSKSSIALFIWTISLWDLKRDWIVYCIQIVGVYLNYFPMGFET